MEKITWKTCCDSLGEHAKNVIAFEKKFLPWAKEQSKSYKEAKLCYICGKTTPEKFSKDKNYRKVRYHYHFTDNYRGAAHNICKLNFNMPDTIL